VDLQRRLQRAVIVMRPPSAALSVAPHPSVHPSRASDFLETGKL